MSKVKIIGVLVIIVLVAVFGYFILGNVFSGSSSVVGSNNGTVNMLSATKGGVSVEYPSNWVLSNSTSNNSIIAVSKQGSVDGSKIGQVNINVEKKEFNGTFDSFLNKTYTNIGADSSFQLISSGELSLDGQKASEYVYTSKAADGSTRQHKAIWFEKNNFAYVVMYSAPADQYELNLPAAEYIIQHIKIN